MSRLECENGIVAIEQDAGYVRINLVDRQGYDFVALLRPDEAVKVGFEITAHSVVASNHRAAELAQADDEDGLPPSLR